MKTQVLEIIKIADQNDGTPSNESPDYYAGWSDACSKIENEVEKLSAWISVRDRLPSLWQRAWLYYEETTPASSEPTYHQTEGMLVKRNCWDAHWLHDTSNISIVAAVTHWQPLPSPPTKNP